MKLVADGKGEDEVSLGTQTGMVQALMGGVYA